MLFYIQVLPYTVGGQLSSEGKNPPFFRKEGMSMDVFQFMQIAGYTLAVFMAGYTFGKKK